MMKRLKLSEGQAYHLMKMASMSAQADLGRRPGDHFGRDKT
jgi:hypothetical protein